MSGQNPSIQLSDRLKAQLPMAQAWIHDTATKPDAKLLELLDERREGFERSLKGITPKQALYIPGEGQWCIDDVARHLAHANNRVAGLIEALTNGNIPGGEPALGVVPRDDRSFEQVKADLLSSFDMLQDDFSNITDAEANLDVKYRHPFFGDLNAREWFVFTFVHASVHIQQIERIKSTPGFPAI
jgi:hypothetical protein